jgi:hypothetical protein
MECYVKPFAYFEAMLQYRKFKKPEKLMPNNVPHGMKTHPLKLPCLSLNSVLHGAM